MCTHREETFEQIRIRSWQVGLGNSAWEEHGLTAEKMTTCYKCDKSPRERWGRTEWWPVWFSGQKIDFNLNPHVTGLFKLSSARDKRIQFTIGIFLLCVRHPLVWWIDMRAPQLFFLFHTTSEGRKMLCAFVLWIIPQLGILTLQCTNEKQYQLEMCLIPYISHWKRVLIHFSLGLTVIQPLCCWCWQHLRSLLWLHPS